MTRCEIKGAKGSIGVILKGGKIVVRECNFKQCGIGILAVGNKYTDIIVKNSNFNECIESIVLAGPF